MTLIKNTETNTKRATRSLDWAARFYQFRNFTGITVLCTGTMLFIVQNADRIVKTKLSYAVAVGLLSLLLFWTFQGSGKK